MYEAEDHLTDSSFGYLQVKMAMKQEEEKKFSKDRWEPSGAKLQLNTSISSISSSSHNESVD